MLRDRKVELPSFHFFLNFFLFFHFLLIRLIVRILMVAFGELLDSLEWLKLS